MRPDSVFAAALSCLMFVGAPAGAQKSPDSDPYTASLVCSVSMRWSTDSPSVDDYRVVIVPATNLDKTLFAMSPDGKPEKSLGIIGLGTIEFRHKGQTNTRRLELVQTQIGRLSGWSIEGIAYDGIFPMYAVTVAVWEKDKPVRVFPFKGGLTARGTCE